MQELDRKKPSGEQYPSVCYFLWESGSGMARPKSELALSDEERQTLTKWASRPKSTQRFALIAQIVLACAEQ